MSTEFDPNIFKEPTDASTGGGGGGSSAFGDITGWPGAASDFIRGDGTDGPILDADLPATSNNSTISAISTVANAALPKAGGTITGAITAGAGTYTPTRGWGTNVNGPVMAGGTGETVALTIAAVNNFYCQGGINVNGVLSQFNAGLSFSGTQASPGASINSIYRDSNGFTRINTATSTGLSYDVNGVEQMQFSAGGIRFVSNQSSLGASITQLYRDSSGNLNLNTQTGTGLNGYCNGTGFFSLAAASGLALYGTTQVSLGGSITQLYRDSGGSLIENVPTGQVVSLTVNGVSQAYVGSGGIVLPTSQSGGGAGNVNIYNSSGSLILNVASANGISLATQGTNVLTVATNGLFLGSTQTVSASSRQIFSGSGGMGYNTTTGTLHTLAVQGITQATIGETGIVLPTAHTTPATTVFGIWRESTLSQTIVQGPISGAAALYCSGSTLGVAAKVHGTTDAARPACITMRSEGKAFTNNGTWTNFYSLAEGTHNGQFFVFSSLYAGRCEVTITGTTITVGNTGGWVGVGSTTGGGSDVSFRVSGGWLQINVGTSISASGYFHAQFEGNVR